MAAAHLQARERQIGYCTPMKTVAYNKFNNNTWFQGGGTKKRMGCMGAYGSEWKRRGAYGGVWNGEKSMELV